MTVTDGSRSSRGAATTEDTALVEVPRYIPLPECLYRLHRRFPRVLESVLLECTRCRQWVAVEVLREIPQETATVSVRIAGLNREELKVDEGQGHGGNEHGDSGESKDAEKLSARVTGTTTAWSSTRNGSCSSGSSSNSFYPLSTHTPDGVMVFGHDPCERVSRFLYESAQARRRMREEAIKDLWRPAGELAAGRAHRSSRGHSNADAQWHSRRLQEHFAQKQQHSSPSTTLLQNTIVDGDATTRANTTTTAWTSPRNLTEEPTRSFFIPNPAVFICGWQRCTQADALLDLRVEWLADLYATAVKDRTIPPLPKSLSANGTSSASCSVHAVMEASAVSAHLWAQRYALNDALARELELRRSCRLFGRGGSAITSSAAAPATLGNGSGTAVCSANAESLLFHHEGELRCHRGRAHSPPGKPPPLKASDFLADAARLFFAPKAEVDTAVASAFSAPSFTAVASAAGTVRDMSTVSTKATTATSAPSPLLLDSIDGMAAPRRAEARVLSAFCWVVCDACGKLRRLTQPFPGGCGAPFVCALTGSVGGCRVPELEGVVRYTAAAAADQAELAIIALASSRLPEPLAVACGHALHGGGGDKSQGTSTRLAFADPFTDPLLRLVHSDAARRAFRYGCTAFPTSGSTSHDSSHASSAPSTDYLATLSHDILPEALPVLRQLAAVVKKRSLGTFAQRLSLTPREIRQKRESVLRAYLFDEPGTDTNETTGTAEAVVKADVGEAGTDSGASRPRGRGGGRGRTSGANVEDKKTKEADAIAEAADKAGVHSRRGKSHTSTTAADIPDGVAKSNRRLSRGYRQTASEAHSRAASASGSGAKRGRPRKSIPSGRPGARAGEGTRTNGPLSSNDDDSSCREEGESDDDGEKATAKRRTRRPRTQASEEPQSPAPAASKSAAAAANPPRRGRGRPRKVDKAATDATATTAASSETSDTIFWVQCDECGKWRILPRRLPKSTTHWECKRRPHTTCADVDDAKMNAEE